MYVTHVASLLHFIAMYLRYCRDTVYFCIIITSCSFLDLDKNLVRDIILDKQKTVKVNLALFQIMKIC